MGKWAAECKVLATIHNATYAILLTKLREKSWVQYCTSWYLLGEHSFKIWHFTLGYCPSSLAILPLHPLHTHNLKKFHWNNFVNDHNSWNSQKILTHETLCAIRNFPNYWKSIGNWDYNYCNCQIFFTCAHPKDYYLNLSSLLWWQCPCREPSGWRKPGPPG